MWVKKVKQWMKMELVGKDQIFRKVEFAEKYG
jgi:hypothetical protein